MKTWRNNQHSQQEFNTPQQPCRNNSAAATKDYTYPLNPKDWNHEQCVKAVKEGQRDTSTPSFKDAWYEYIAEGKWCFKTVNSKDPNLHELSLLRAFLTWIYSDSKYSASYYKNLVEQPGFTTPPQPNRPTASTSQSSNWKPAQPKFPTPKGKGIGKGSPIGVGALPPPMHPPPADPPQPQHQPNTPPPTAQSPNPKQQVDTDRVVRALDEATTGNQYNAEMRKEIQHKTAE